jgi:hypothetical protein
MMPTITSTISNTLPMRPSPMAASMIRFLSPDVPDHLPRGSSRETTNRGSGGWSRTVVARSTVDEGQALVHQRHAEHPVHAIWTPDELELPSVLSDPGVGGHDEPKSGRVDELDAPQIHDETLRLLLLSRGERRLNRLCGLEVEDATERKDERLVGLAPGLD